MWWDKNNNYSNKIKAVENNQRIKIHMSGYIWDVICVNNMPSQEKMFIRYFYNDKSAHEKVINYSGEEFEHFDVLNVYEAKRAPNINR